MAILKQQNPKIQYLTDDVILAYTGDNVLYDYRDINQKTPLNIGYTGGVYDPKIFGSIFANQCNCGEVRGTGIVCTKCGTMALPKEEKYSRFARIDLKYYYCNNLRMAELVKYLRANYKFKILASSDNSVVAKSNIAAGSLDTCQFEADKDSGKIVVTDEITDFNKVSFEGLLKAIEDLGGNTTIVKRFLNKSILVVPAALRPVRLSIDTTEDGKKLLEIHDISLVYKSIIYINNVLIPELMEDKEYSLKAKALQLGCYRKYFSQALVAMSGLLKPSKESFARQLQAARLGDSGRCTIVPKPELKANEVMIPRHMMYEVCKQEFVQWLQRKNGWDEIKALNQYEEHPLDKQTQDWFDEYINGDPNDPNDRKMVIICRNPTLHKLNLLACKVILTNEMCMGISLPTCKRFAGKVH